MMRAPPSPAHHNFNNIFNPHTQASSVYDFDFNNNFMYSTPKQQQQSWNSKGRIPTTQYPATTQTSYSNPPSYAFGNMQTGFSGAPSISLQQTATPEATPVSQSRRATPAQSPARTQFVGTTGGDWSSLYVPTSEPTQNYGNYLKVETGNNYLAPYQNGQSMGRIRSDNGQNDDLPPLSASSRPSVSEGGYYSPLTPSTSPNPENGLAGIRENSFERVNSWMDQYLQYPPDMSETVPKTEPLENYSYSGVATASRPRQNLPSRVSPGASMPDLYHQAQSAHPMSRTSSQGVQANTRTSPFRASSPFHPGRTIVPNSPVRHTTNHLMPNIGYASAQRELQQEAQSRAIQQESERVVAPSKTISPKEAFLDFHEPEDDASKINLFATPSDLTEDLLSQASQAESQQSTYDFMDPTQHMGFPPQTAYDFTHTPAMSGIPQNYQYQDIVQKPALPKDHGGAYACSEPGCNQRFTTPTKLSKHRRDFHRQSTPGSTMHHGMTTTAHIPKSHIPGPHKCTRINPTTGKPCNTVFSRPYDLTRHEDTIHNTTREKARCDICNDEKTFSRQDALTRHKKVKHGIEK